MSFSVSNEVTATITIESQSSVATMANALDYAINNSSSLTQAQKDELAAVKNSLATLY